MQLLFKNVRNHIQFAIVLVFMPEGIRRTVIIYKFTHTIPNLCDNLLIKLFLLQLLKNLTGLVLLFTWWNAMNVDLYGG